ncbi:MAG: 16S rRNA (guanine(966)-N(2))-methyltransferase RsmD [bacterium]
MRITAGKFKCQKINSIDSNEVRPTSSKVRESIFNIIQSSITDSVMLDLFAGSGCMGLEALSRGAKKVVFIEKNPKVFKILKENLNNFDCEHELYLCDAFVSLERMKNQKFNIIFVDPPYRLGYEFDVCKRVCDYNLLEEDGLLIIEHLSKLDMEKLLQDLPLTLTKYKKYGDTALSIFEKLNANSPETPEN